MTDQNRKTLRSFYCRDHLWEMFEQMTHDLGCTMDYLINESMRSYAQSRDYAPNKNQAGGQNANSFGQPQQPNFNAPVNSGINNGNPNPFAPMEQHQTFDRIPPVSPAQPTPQTGGIHFGAPSPMPPPPPTPAWQQQNPPNNGFAQNQSFGQQQQQSPQPSFTTQPPVYLIFKNNRYGIDKDNFVVGRGSQQTDLTIRDGNISRQHCAVLFQNGSYYIKDLGSTNGIEFRGSRIESKKIDEGDVFYLCDYELRFTYHP